MDGRLLGLLAPLQVRAYVLQYHYGVVNHHTDGDRKRGHGYDVQGVSGRKKIDQRAQQRDRDGKYDDESRPPSSQEHEDDQHDDQEGDEYGLLERVDRIEDFRGIVHDLGYLDIRWECGLYLLDPLLGGPYDIDRIGTALLLDGDHGRSPAVGVRFLGFLLEAVIHPCHIPEIDHLPEPVTDNDIEQFRRILEFLLNPEGEGFGTDVDASGRDIAVLGRDDLRDSSHAQSIGLELCRVAVYMDLPGRRSGH